MTEPSRAGSRRALAGGVVTAIALATVAFIAGRATVSPAPAPVARAPSPAPSPSPATAPAGTTRLVDPPLDRAGLLDLARRAADAAADGRPLADAAALDGRRFELRLPFGCPGSPVPNAALPGAPMGWTYDAERQTLRVAAVPTRFAPADWLAGDAATIDGAEGFWIERPWSSREACPPAGPTPPAPERAVALVEFHGATASRVGRRDGEAFRAVVRTARDALDLSAGLRLRLTGRLAIPPGQQGPAICRSSVGGGRPVCALAVSLDEVAIENSATTTTLATWALPGASRQDD